MSTQTCRCGKSWTGLKPEHCPACHETFGGTTAGDRHRRNFTCLLPTNCGLVQDDKGIWRFPSDDANRARLDALGAT